MQSGSVSWFFHRVQGVEAGLRVLKDHADFAAAYLSEFRAAQPQQVDAVETDGIRGHLGVLWKKAHHREHGHTLAGAGFAHHAQRFAHVQVERNAAHGLHDADADVKACGQVFDFEESGHQALRYFFRRGSSASRRPSPIKLNENIVTQTAMTERSSGGD
jgi:hypothetical protein